MAFITSYFFDNNTESIDESTIIFDNKKLLHTKNGKLVLNKNIKNITNTKIISIIGDARKGKSTFLNCIINFLTNENIEYFKVQSSLEHCTIGMDYLELEINENKLLFIDCQGLNYEKSSDDSKYLLFLYAISNVIIFNEMNIINNNIFTTLQPMALFMNHFEKINNKSCILFIRIADYDLDEDCNKLKEKLFTKQEDQYDNTRESVKKLFNSTDNIHILHTLSLDRGEKKLLKENNYMSILEKTENNFRNSLEIIIRKLFELENISINLEKLVESINNNERIDYKKLDVYTLYTTSEIKEFIDENLYDNTEIFNFVSKNDINLPLPITGFSDCRFKLDNIIDNIRILYDKFNQTFSKVPKNLRKEFDTKIKDISSFISTCIEENKCLAAKNIKPFHKKYVKEIEKIINNSNLLFENNFMYDLTEYKTELSVFDYNAVEVEINKFTKLLNSIDSKIIICNKHNNTQIDILKKRFDSIKKEINYNNIIDQTTLENCKNGNYKEFILENNPYKYVLVNDIKFKIFEKNSFEIIDKKLLEITSEYKFKYLSNYLENGKEYENYYISKLKEILVKEDFFLELPQIKHDQINFIKINLIFHPEMSFDVFIEKDYLKTVLNIDNILFNLYTNYYINNMKNHTDLTFEKINNNPILLKLFTEFQFEAIINKNIFVSKRNIIDKKITKIINFNKKIDISKL